MEIIQIIEIIIIGGLSYLIGTFPSAYFITKYATGKDIRSEGTGNIGAANTLDITGNKLLSFLVFLLDFLKGAIAIIGVNTFFYGQTYKIAIATVFVILGHIINIFMDKKGGRGLATALGATFVITPLAGFLWCLVWVISSKLFKKNVHYANILASILSPVMLINTPKLIINNLSIVNIDDIVKFKIMFVMVNLMILIKHKEYFKDFIDEFKGNS